MRSLMYYSNGTSATHTYQNLSLSNYRNSSDTTNYLCYGYAFYYANGSSLLFNNCTFDM